jgi:hypothetical protein
MTMDAQERSEFVDAYTRVLITTWSNEEFAARLDQDLRGALAECGLVLPADAIAERVRDVPDVQPEGGLDVQIDAWERGFETGHFYLHIPDAPDLDISELTEGELEAIAAGEISIYCCCCPCCSC